MDLPDPPTLPQRKVYRLDESVGYLIKRVRLAMSLAVDRELVEFDISHDQLSILLMMTNGKGDTAAELSREMACDTSSMTRMIDRLEAKGLVKRTRSEDDRRVVRLATTEAGEALCDRLPDLMNRVLDRHLAGFTEQEVEQLKGLLRRMVNNACEASADARSTTESSTKNN